MKTTKRSAIRKTIKNLKHGQCALFLRIDGIDSISNERESDSQYSKASIGTRLIWRDEAGVLRSEWILDNDVEYSRTFVAPWDPSCFSFEGGYMSDTRFLKRMNRFDEENDISLKLVGVL